MGYVDSADKVILDFQYLGASSFRNGLSFVHTSSVVSPDAYGKPRGQRFLGIIDKKGHYVIEPRLGLDVIGYGSTTFSSPIAFRTEEGKYGFLNLSGDVQIPAVYDDICGFGTFSEGKAAVKSGKFWGVIDTNGEWLVPPRYDNLQYYWKGHIPFQANGEELWGFLDAQGEVALEPKYTNIIFNFSLEGPWVVELEGKKGVLGENLEILVAPRYEKSSFRQLIRSTYRGGLVFMDDSGVYKALDTQGKEIFRFPALFAEVLDAVEGYYVLKGSGVAQSFLVSKSGKMLLPPEFVYLYPGEEGVITASRKDGLWGLIKIEQ